MKFFLRAAINTRWDDPPEVSTYTHTLDNGTANYIEEVCRMDFVDNSQVFDLIPMPSWVPDSVIVVIAEGELTGSRDYFGEYDEQIDYYGIQYSVEPSPEEKDPDGIYILS